MKFVRTVLLGLLLLFMAVPTFVAAGAIATDLNGAASVTPTPPTHVANDILIAVAYNDFDSDMATATAGWTQLTSQGTPGNFGMAFWWKRATAAGTAGPTITAAGTDQFAYVLAYRGCITTGSPFENYTPNSGTSTTPTGTIVVTTGADRLVVALEIQGLNTAFSSGYPPSGWTNDSRLTSASGTTAGFAAISKTRLVAGNESAPTLGTLASSVSWNVSTFALIPVPPSAPSIDTLVMKNQAVNRASVY
jgi:hypothetical protein